LRPAFFVGCDDLTVEYRVAHSERGCNLVAEVGEAAHQVAVARDHAAATLREIAEAAKAVVFEIKEPLRVVDCSQGSRWRPAAARDLLACCRQCSGSRMES
jgi:hypothetical protein